MARQTRGGRMGGEGHGGRLDRCASPVFPVRRRRTLGIDPDDKGTGDDKF